jgi:hypothetical protein
LPATSLAVEPFLLEVGIFAAVDAIDHRSDAALFAKRGYDLSGGSG